MFMPNTTALLFKKSARRTITGKEIFAPGRMIMIAVVHLKESVVQTSVRADASATRGGAQQHEAEAKLLLPATVTATRGDVIVVGELNLEVTGTEKRFDVLGSIDHVEVTCAVRAEF